MDVTYTALAADGPKRYWVEMLKATGMKLVMLPDDADVNPLELVRKKAIAVRGTGKRLKALSKKTPKSK